MYEQFLLVIDYEEKKKESKLNAIVLNFIKLNKTKS
jgi:hypothetical protein